MRTLIRFFSYLYHGLLACFLFVASALVLGGGPLSLRLAPVPWWSGPTLAYIVMAGSLVGIAVVCLALAGKVRIAFFVWSLLVLLLVIKGYLFSGYRIAQGDGTMVACLILFSLIALAGAWFQLSRDSRRPVRY